MDDSGHRENGSHRVDYYKGVPSQWNMPQYQVRDPNAMMMNKKFMQLVTERKTAIKERDQALSKKKAALEERDMAIQQRDAAIADRNDAVRERDNAIAALRFQESTMTMYVQRGSKQNQHHATQPSYMRDLHVTEAFPITTVEPVQKSRITKETKARGGSIKFRENEETEESRGRFEPERYKRRFESRVGCSRARTNGPEIKDTTYFQFCSFIFFFFVKLYASIYTRC